MINFLLISLLINSLFARKDRLYCGLFGWIGSSLENFDMSNIRLLGIMNDERGGDGFGLYNGSKHYKSSTPGKFKDGLKKDRKSVLSLVPNKYPIFMGHTRKRSRGYTTLDYTHPIVITAKDKLSIYLTHNGTIDNLPTVCEEIGAPSFDSKENMSDTQMLASLLLWSKSNDRSFRPILEKYDGSASLAFAFSDDPGKLYLFRGESKTYASAATVSQERPLFIMEHRKKGIYYSSIKDSLEYLMEKSGFREPEELEANTLFAYKGLKQEIVLKVDRSNATRPHISTVTSRNVTHTPSTSSLVGRALNHANTGGSCSVNSRPETLDNGLRKDPILKYLDTHYNGVGEIEEKFHGSITATLAYLRKAYHKSSIFTEFYKPISIHNKSRVFFTRGRYIIKTIGSAKAASSLAHGRYHLDEEGILCPKGNGRTYGFVWGVMVPVENINGLLELTHASTFRKYMDCPNPLCDFQETYTNRESLRRFLNVSLYPIAPFFNPLGTLMTLNDHGYPVPYEGTFEPKFCDMGFNIQNGIIRSKYPRDTGTIKPDNTVIDADIPSQLLDNCPSCAGDSIMCDVCDGAGYVTAEVAENFKQLATTASKERETSTTKGSEDTYSVVQAQLALEEQADTVAVECLKKIGSAIEAERNDIEVLGEETKLIKDITKLFDDVETEVMKLLGYES